jgi:hypothetical protein
MRRTKLSVMMLMAPMTAALLTGLAGCGGGYVDVGPEWDGTVYLGGGYDGRYERDHHPQAFRDEGGRHPAGAVSDRGRASMGARAAGGGHASSGGGGHASSGGGHR